jgi:hypothetical protein
MVESKKKDCLNDRSPLRPLQSALHAPRGQATLLLSGVLAGVVAGRTQPSRGVLPTPATRTTGTERMNEQNERTGSTYLDHAQAQIARESGGGRWANPSPYVVGSQPTVAAPTVARPHWAEADTGVEPPLPMEPHDLRGPTVGVALGGGSVVAPSPCFYTTPTGACALVIGGVGPCPCVGGR